jgi:hypothetical protein
VSAIFPSASQAKAGDSDRGYVVTLDDITELVAAQRTSAQADVARRIAHDQESADPDSAFGRMAAPEVRQMIEEDRGVFELHGHNCSSGGRYPAHGRRVLAFCADAEARNDR